MLNLNETLNPRQREAATTLQGPVEVLAGAGSGKTRTLTYRTANLVENNVKPINILTLTFTNKAAEDMGRKIKELLGEEKIKGMWMGTFHSICLRILLQNLSRINRLKGVSIYDTADSTDVISDIVQDLGLDKKTYNKKLVLSIISKAKMSLLYPKDIVEKYAKEGFGSQEFYKNIARIYVEYEKILDNNNALDFNDLIKKTIELFRNYPEVLKKYQTMFKYIQVDEYQDTNHSQYVIASLLAKPENNLFVVGDDWQSIYGFRGADISNILDFEKDYPNAKIIKLERNYRSTSNIINASNKVIHRNTQNKKKVAWTDEEDGQLIHLFKCNNPFVEAQYVAKKIQELVEMNYYKYNDFTILYRSNYQSLPFERAFKENRIPFNIVGGVGFFDRQEIKYFLSYLRLMVNPNDHVAIQRIFRIEAEGVGEGRLSDMHDYAIQNDMQLINVMGNPSVVKGIGPKTSESIINFKNRVIDKLFEIQQKDIDLAAKARRVYKLVDYEENVLKTLSNFEKREENIDRLFDDIYNYADTNPEKTLHDYLLYNKLVSDQDNLEEGKEKVNLMTTHTAKGLEFPVIFVVGLEEDTFPHHISIKEEATGKNPYAIEEERRLFYVAMTRAEKRLFLSYSTEKERFRKTETMYPSRFLFEVPKERMEMVEVFRKYDYYNDQYDMYISNPANGEDIIF